MIVIYAIIAIFIAWIWVDYYRLIDIYQKNSLWLFLLTFVLGGLNVWTLTLFLEHVLDKIPFAINGNIVNDFLYCWFRIGLVEELTKLIPFLIIFYAFRSHFKEPIDYIAFISTSALGFAAVENVMYFHNYGAFAISGRAILSTVSHMIDTSIIGYALVVIHFKKTKNGVGWFILALFIASLSHGFYDFWLINEYAEGWGWSVTVLYFFVTISLFATIINNSLNNSAFMTYKKVVNPNKVAGRLIIYYAIILMAQIVLGSIEYDVITGIGGTVVGGLPTMFIVTVTCGRLSRFKLIKQRWNPLKLELPFAVGKSNWDAVATNSVSMQLSLKGESFNAVYITKHYHEECQLIPIRKKSYLGEARKAYIKDKLFLKNDESFFVTDVFFGNPENDEVMYIKPKTSGTKMMYSKYPIVALFKIDHLENPEDPNLTPKDFKFKGWVYVKPLENQQK